MCLAKITKTFNPPLPEEREAFKVVEVLQFLSFSEETKSKRIFTPYQNLEILPERWILAIKRQICTPFNYNSIDSSYYDSGFHVFPTFEDAQKAFDILSEHNTGATWENRKIIKVLVKDIAYEGIDGTRTYGEFEMAKIPNLVAYQIFVPQASLEALENQEVTTEPLDLA